MRAARTDGRDKARIFFLGAVLLAGAVTAAAPPGEAAAASRAVSYSGLTLADALGELRSQGVRILFSSALVRPDMRVLAEPAATSPPEVLAQLLGPHGLAVYRGPDGTLLVVPGRLPPSRPRVTLRGRVRERDTGIVVAGAEIVLEETGDVARSGSDGSFAVKGLAPGVYSLEASRVGFVRQRLENVRLAQGGPTEIDVLLLPLPATLEEIEVVPQLEVGSIHSGTLLYSAELERVPTPRDPWAVVTQAAGILSDRINVGGSESGSQARFLAPGSSFEENTFSIDGVNTTDMAALGASAIYYDFDQFQELQVSTGGAGVKTATAGVAIRMITKRGTPSVRGSGRFLRTDAEGIFGFFEQGSSDVSGKLAPGQDGADRGNEVDRILDTGLELGGPLLRDRLWGWGSYGVDLIDLVVVGGAADDTELTNGAFKLSAQPSSRNSLVVSWNTGDKRKGSRGAGPSRAPEATWRQFGPTRIYKLEDSHVVGRKLFLSGSYDFVDAGFSLIPRGGAGPEGGEALLDVDGVWKNSYFGGSSDRDSRTLSLEGSLLLGGDLRRTLEAGGSSRAYRYSDDFRWPGPNQAYHVACNNVGRCSEEDGFDDLVIFERRGELLGATDYVAVWTEHSLEAGRWSFSAGLRLDAQGGRNPPGRTEANPALPEALPAVDFDGNDGGVDWLTLSPRLSAAYLIDEGGETLLRLSLGRFVEQLGTDDVGRVNPLDGAELTYAFRDSNGDHLWQRGEELRFLAPYNFDPADPRGTANRIAPGLDPELTDELLVGIEKAFSSDWIAGINFTYRRITDISETRPLVRDGGAVREARRGDYVFERASEVTLPDGRRRTATFYALDPALVLTGGGLLTNGDRAREYFGLTLSFNRRPSERWTMRGYLNWGEATWSVPESFREVSDPTDLAGFGDDDGDLYAAQSSGFRRGIFLQSTWSAHWSGYYRIAPLAKWGFTVASSVFARQGYPIPYMSRFVSDVDGIDREGQVTDGIGEFRADDVLTVDLSLEKRVRFRKRYEATFSLSAFNLFNENFVLQRERNLTSPRANHLDESLAPRIFRLGFRVTW